MRRGVCTQGGRVYLKVLITRVAWWGIPQGVDNPGSMVGVPQGVYTRVVWWVYLRVCIYPGICLLPTMVYILPTHPSVHPAHPGYTLARSCTAVYPA